MKRGFEYGVIHHLTQNKNTVAEILFAELGLSQQEIPLLLNLGAIYLNGSRIVNEDQFKSELPVNSYLRVHTKPRRYPINQVIDPSRLIFQNDDFIIFDKPSGIPCHPTVDNKIENLIFQLTKKLGIDLFITHRLDNATSGFLVLAKTKKFQTAFNLLLSERQVRKIYRAQIEYCEKWIPHQILIHYMEPSPRAPKSVDCIPHQGWQECQLKILEIEQQLDCTSLTIELLTGRTHQIRSQLAFEGFPIQGDSMYGSKVILPNSSGLEKIELRSVNLEFSYNDQLFSFS